METRECPPCIPLFRKNMFSSFVGVTKEKVRRTPSLPSLGRINFYLLQPGAGRGSEANSSPLIRKSFFDLLGRGF